MNLIERTLAVLGNLYNAICLVALVLVLFRLGRNRLQEASPKTKSTLVAGTIVLFALLVVSLIFYPGTELPAPPNTPIYFAPEASIAPQPARAAAVEACIAEAERAIEFTRTFSVQGQARCPGGGCLFRSSSCNRRVAYAGYDAPGPYYLDSYRIEGIETHYGSRGGIEVTSRDEEGRAMGVRVELVCNPPDRPGAPGGWSRATITGIERLRNERQVREEIATRCEES